MTISSVTPSSPFVSLDAFAKAAQSGEDVYVDIAGETLRVLGVGSTPGGRSVAWVAPNVDTTGMFAQALARSYGQGIASAVSRELGLEPNPGKPLSARTVTLALDMAQTSRDALSGVDFMTRLALSATNDAPAFQQACRDAGVAPSGLPAGLSRRRRGALRPGRRAPRRARPGHAGALRPGGRIRPQPGFPGHRGGLAARPAQVRLKRMPAKDSAPRNILARGLLVFTYLT
ncbi:Uncharacterised protein [Achromobacter xylosoxidans]|uniref:hypothetical protein n=1 Tax=Alcaligenes xylosoxydans xylosoxydans TaxID=85698 RepID=UPI0006C48191|nr:hypothetical protein [Achromobacter xylosoxidans]CUI80767.1 Uncharacterised protein [Achromobacter xylosoxidans]